MSAPLSLRYTCMSRAYVKVLASVEHVLRYTCGGMRMSAPLSLRYSGMSRAYVKVHAYQ
jgi:hypothetical protein